MIEEAEAETEESTTSSSQAHLSHSQINRYLQCPEQYRLYYVERWRPRAPRASLVFGLKMHEALAWFFREGKDPEGFIRQAWQEAKGMTLSYSSRDSWQKFLEAGIALLDRFTAKEGRRLSNVQAVEQSFSLDISGLELPFVGIIDLVADLDGRRTVIDFKTSSMRYASHEVALSDQLTAYQLASPQTPQLALCILVRSVEPRIEWHLTRRGTQALVEYLAKVELVARAIASGHFYKRPGKWCSWCEFLPLCLGDERRVRETLIQIR